MKGNSLHTNACSTLQFTLNLSVFSNNGRCSNWQPHRSKLTAWWFGGKCKIHARKLFHQKSFMLETYPGLRQIAFDNRVCAVHHKFWPSYEMAVVLHSSAQSKSSHRLYYLYSRLVAVQTLNIAVSYCNTNALGKWSQSAEVISAKPASEQWILSSKIFSGV